MFGTILRSLRLESKKTQSELATILKTSPSTIGMYEQNRRTPDLETLKEISGYFNVSIDYLMGKSDIKYSADHLMKNINDTNKLNNSFKNTDITTIPMTFEDAEQARLYISKHAIFGSNGFKPDLMSDEQILEFANELLKQMEMVSYKYR